MLDNLMMVNFSDSELTAGQWGELAACSREVSKVASDSADFERLLPQADGIILRLGMSADREFMERAPNLRYIGMYGTGYGRIDVATAKAREVTVTNVRDYATESVAEFVVAAVVNQLRDLVSQLGRAASGVFQEPEIPGSTLQSQRVGIVGLGAIGARTATLFQAFGCHVSYFSRTRRPNAEEAGIEYQELDDLLHDSAVISLHVAAAAETTPLITAERIATLSQGTILVNTAPNEVVDLAALERRLQRGELVYIFDHTDELPEDDAKRLASLSAVVAYPPLGYVTHEASDTKQQILVDNVSAFVAGRPLNVV